MMSLTEELANNQPKEAIFDRYESLIKNFLLVLMAGFAVFGVWILLQMYAY